jgi:SAM-dependent methyltransferase
MADRLSIIIPFDQSEAQQAASLANSLTGHEVILAGPSSFVDQEIDGARVATASGKGAAIRSALSQVGSPVTVIHDAGFGLSPALHENLAAPILSDEADAVYGKRSFIDRTLGGIVDRAIVRVTRFVADAPISDPLTGIRAFRTVALKNISLQSDGANIDVEILYKLSAQLYRLAEVAIDPNLSQTRSTVQAQLERARGLLRYASIHNDADNQHDGYNTLVRLDGANNYNAWIGQQMRPFLGKRVLEVGAGIGTITRQIAVGRELVIALEVDQFYVERLKNAFRNQPNVRPYLSGVERADWERLALEDLDTIVASNVIEHLRDDAQAVRNFRRVLKPGGRVVIWVPALPQLYGSIDEAVGHFRRYTKNSLRAVLEGNGFVVERIDWMNVAGIPAWFFNGRVLRRRAVPPLQLRVYDWFAPMLAKAENRFNMPFGMSLFAVARARSDVP